MRSLTGKSSLNSNLLMNLRHQIYIDLSQHKGEQSFMYTLHRNMFVQCILVIAASWYPIQAAKSIGKLKYSSDYSRIFFFIHYIIHANMCLF